jgi:ribosomal protein S18 acetylase RimI-like enzyme
MKIRYIELDPFTRKEFATQRGKNGILELHIDMGTGMIPGSFGGFTIAALANERFVGFAEVYIKRMENPLDHLKEAYFEQIHVIPEFRRMGIASHLVKLCLERAKTTDVYQIRGFSATDRTEALRLWEKFGFCLCYSLTVGSTWGYYFVMKKEHIAQQSGSSDALQRA